MNDVILAASGAVCLWSLVKTWDRQRIWLRSKCTGNNPDCLGGWNEEADGEVPETCPDCGRKVIMEEGDNSHG